MPDRGFFFFFHLIQRTQTPPFQLEQHGMLFCLLVKWHIQKKYGYQWVWLWSQRARGQTQIIVLHWADVMGGSESLCGCLGDDWQLFTLHTNTKRHVTIHTLYSTVPPGKCSIQKWRPRENMFNNVLLLPYIFGVMTAVVHTRFVITQICHPLPFQITNAFTRTLL